MRPARLLVLAVVAAAVAGLVLSWGGRPAPEVASVDRPPVPAVRTSGAGASTWFCSAGRAPSDPGPPAHLVLLTSLAPRPVTLRLQAFGTDGPGPEVTRTVPPGAVTPVDVGATFGDPAVSVAVESPSAAVAVEHRIVNRTLSDADQVPCSTFSSDRWYFPSVTTTRDATALLTLFNPFPADAGVDLSIVLDSGVRTPTSLTGIVVPARSTRVVDLGQVVQRREQFAVRVRLRSGRVVAELAQGRNGALGQRGLRLEPGVPAAARRWAFAGGFTGAGVSEQLVLLNPGDRRAGVAVQVTPYGGASAAPEPLQAEVPAGRWVVLDLGAESRIPGDGYHAVLVDSPDAPVVAARVLAVTGAPAPPATSGVVARPAVTSGLADGHGSPVSALRWLVPAVDLYNPPAVVLVHNPGRGIAVVTVSLVSPSGTVPLQGADEVEVAAGDSVAVPLDLSTLGGAPPTVALEVRASSPVVTERVVTFGPAELAMGDAVPVRFAGGGLEDLGLP